MSDRGARTRTSMLEAGARRTATASLDDYLAFLRPEDIAASAERSKSTFFHHWPSLHDYITELTAGALAPAAETGLARALASAATEGDGQPKGRSPGVADSADGDAIVSWLRGVAMAAFDGVTENPDFHLYLLANACGGDVTAERLREVHGAMDQRIGNVIESYLKRSGLEVRDPFTPEVVATAFSAAALGLAMRARFDPDRVTAMLYADVIAALLPVLVATPESNDIPFDEFVDRAMLRPVVTDTEPADSMRELAEDAPSTMLEAARTATRILREQVVPEVEAGLDADLAIRPALSGTDVVCNHLVRLHALAADRPAVTMAAIGATSAISVARAAPAVPDPLADSGLDGVTRRAISTIGDVPPDPELGQTVRSLELSMLRTAVGIEPLPLERLLLVARVTLGAMASDPTP